MALTETTEIDQIEITKHDTIQVRTAKVILRDGTEIHREFHRHVLTRNSDLSKEDPKVRAVAATVWSD